MRKDRDADRDAAIAGLLELDQQFDVAGFPPLHPETAAHCTQCSPEGLVSAATLQFLHRWQDALRAHTQLAQRCVRCQADGARCAMCTGDRIRLHRLAAVPIALCRTFAARVRRGAAAEDRGGDGP